MNTDNKQIDSPYSVWPGLKKALKVIFLLFSIIVIGALICIYIVTDKLVHKLIDPDNHEIELIASMMPLWCSVYEFQEHADEYEEFANFIDEALQKKDECTNSPLGSIKCAKQLYGTLKNPESYFRGIQKGSQLYQAHNEFKSLASRTVKRIEAIETYDENTAKLKQDLVSLARYVNNNLNIVSLVTKSDEILEGIEERAIILGNDEQLIDNIIVNTMDKYYPEIFIVLHPLVSKISFAIIVNHDEFNDVKLERLFVRSKTFRDEWNHGCITKMTWPAEKRNVRSLIEHIVHTVDNW